jgi:hypothetical protein
LWRKIILISIESNMKKNGLLALGAIVMSVLVFSCSPKKAEEAPVTTDNEAVEQPVVVDTIVVVDTVRVVEEVAPAKKTVAPTPPKIKETVKAEEPVQKEEVVKAEAPAKVEEVAPAPAQAQEGAKTLSAKEKRELLKAQREAQQK